MVASAGGYDLNVELTLLLPLPCCRFTGYWIGVGSRLSSVIGRGGSDDHDDEEPLPALVKAAGLDVREAKQGVEGTAEGEEDEGSDDDEDDDDDESSEDEDGPIEGLDKIQAGFMEECKLVSTPYHRAPDADSRSTCLVVLARLTDVARPM